MRHAILQAGMLLYRARYWRPVERLAREPDVAQRDALRRLLVANRETRFGIEHGFKDIRDHKELLARVPVQEYEMLRPYVDEQRSSGSPALTAEPPLFYAQTSGTTGKPKLIPITRLSLSMHQAEQALFSYLQFRACPEAFAGKALGIMGAAVEGRLDSGHAVGSVSGHLYRSLPRFVQSRFVVPPEVSSIQNYDLKYLVILRLALSQPGVTYMGSPNPTTFLRMLEILNERRDLLLDSLSTGTFDALDREGAELRAVVARRLTPDPALAARLGRMGRLTFADVWPGIRLVTTWTGGSCGIALDRLRSELPAACRIMELGYQATECRGTIALEADSPGGLPPLHHHFFEFVRQEDWDSGRSGFLTLEQLETGRRYYILITTAAGLYRYFMNDLVEVTGHFHRTPLLRFVQKGKGVTSLTGEKLYEAQIIEAVRDAGAQWELKPSFFLLVADEQHSTYRLFIELNDADPKDALALAAAVDHRLGELNIEYHAKRTSGRLGPLSVAWLARGAAEAYKSAAVRAGQREGQYKPTVLDYASNLVMRLEDYVIP